MDTNVFDELPSCLQSGQVDVIPLLAIYGDCGGSCACRTWVSPRHAVISLHLIEMRKSSRVIQFCG